MKIVVMTPVLAGESATCRVSGANDVGYIKVKVNGTYAAKLLPDAHPGVALDERLVTCPPNARGYDVWADPPWSAGDTLDFELYDLKGTTHSSAGTTVI